MSKIENKQYIVFLILGIIGAPLMMSMIPFVSVLGCFAVIICIPSLFSSVFTREKFVGSKCVILDNGEKYQFSVVKVNYHQASIFLIPFLSFFYFIPVRRKYILIHNMGCQTIKPNTKIPSDYCDPGALMDSEYISRKQFKQLMTNPQAFKDTFQFRLNKRKNDFNSLLPLLKEALGPKETIEHNNYVLFEQENLKLAFTFNGDSKEQHGLIISPSLYEKNKDGFTDNLFTSIINTPADIINNHHLLFTEDRLKKNLYVEYFKEKAKAKENADNTTENIEVKTEAPQPLVSQNTQNNTEKTVLTNQMIATRFTKPAPFIYKALKYLFYFLGFEFAAAAVLSFFMMVPLAGLVMVPITIALFYGAKKMNKKIQESIIPGNTSQFKVYKTLCIGIKDVTPVSDDPEYAPPTKYKYTFLNNKKITSEFNPNIKYGVPCYLVYSTETNKFVFAYDSQVVELAPDVEYEDEMC